MPKTRFTLYYHWKIVQGWGITSVLLFSTCLVLSGCSQPRPDPAAEAAAQRVEAARQAKRAQQMKEWSAEENRKRAMWAAAEARG